MASSTEGNTRPVRLADIARAAGVSHGTASNVFSRPEIVREEVRERVKAAAEAMGYAGPDPKGRLLRAGKVNAIGVATTEPLSYFFDDPFARTMMAGISEACDATGAGIALVSAGNEEKLAWNIQSALVDGFILFCIEGGSRLVELAAQHLAGLGHRRFAVLALPFADGSTGPASPERIRTALYTGTRDRLVGYFEALSRFGVDTADVPVYETENDEASTKAGLETIFASAEPPTAILAMSDRMAMVAIEWLAARGMAVPDDVSIVGFDGVPDAALCDPPLTTVAQPIAEIGRRAARTILDFDGTVRRETLGVELVVRASSGPPPKTA
jgi:DNA-binding LacI/PurR family transcriptional regulator